MVGTSGAAETRFNVVTPSGRILPLFTCGIPDRTVANIAEISPEIRLT